jgi:TPR repeat protein
MVPATQDIFIGYAEGDRSRAQPLVAASQKAGLSVTAAIFDGISGCDDILQRPFETTRCSVVLWSQAAASSLAGKELANHAIQAWWLNRLVLLTLDDTPLPSGLRDVPTTPLRGASATDIAEPMAGIHKIVDKNSTAGQLSAKRVHTRKIATFVVVGLLVALATGIAVYQSSFYPSPRPKHALNLPDSGPGLSSLPHNRDLELLAPGAPMRAPGVPMIGGAPTIGAETEAARLLREREAAQLLMFAAGKGNSDAQRKLASFYEFGRGGLPRDNDQAARLYKQSADQGNADAQLELGVVHEVGRIGIQKNDERAQHYYELAATQGNARAQYQLGRFHEFGRGGLLKDSEMAAFWYRKAADQGEVDASYRLANLLSNDTNTDRSAMVPVPLIGPTGFPWRIVMAGLAISAIICGAAFYLYNVPRQKLAKLSYTLVSKDTKPAGGSAPQVFVSYSRVDSDVVDRIVAQIKQLGYTVWIDREETSSQRYAATIVAAIRTARLVALMCSRHSVTSDQVVREVYVAGDCKKPFVIFQLDSTQFPDEFLYFLSGYPRIGANSLDTARLRSQIAKAII